MTNKSVYGMSSTRWQMRRASFAVLLATAALSFAACSPKSDDNSASTTPGNVTLTDEQRHNIHLYTVVPSRFHNVIETTGVVDFDNDQSTSVMAPISGPVTRLLVSPGDDVKKGQPLAAVASPDFAAAVSTYRKALTTAQTTRRVADIDKDLIAHDGVARREEEQAQTDATNAEADRDAALQGLVALNVDPETIKDVQEGRSLSRIEGLIRSPIAGTVVEKLITPGELLQAGTTAAFTVADLSRVWVMAQAFETDLGAVHIGDTAKVMTGTAASFSGTVTAITPEIDPNTHSMQVRVAVDNPGRLLKKQMYVRVQIQARQQSDGVLVPVSAILRDDENLPFVYVSQPDGSFARRGVTLGSRIGDSYVIPSGLRARDQIVVDGALFVQFMQNQ